MDDQKTGDEWNRSGLFDFKVLDPDGWDRKTMSFFDEKISADEFKKRAMRSTIQQRVRDVEQSPQRTETEPEHEKKKREAEASNPYPHKLRD